MVSNADINVWLKGIKRFLSLVMVAIMIGVSNIIMEEDRTINDTRARIEQQMIVCDEED